MAVTEAEIEALALGAMRAWVAGDAKAMKKLLAKDFLMLVGTTPPQLLDQPSFLGALSGGFACRKFTFREVIARKHRDAAWFVAGAELDLALGGRAWTGPFLVSALWRKSAWSSRMLLAELSLARLDADTSLTASVARLQLWK